MYIIKILCLSTTCIVYFVLPEGTVYMYVIVLFPEQGRGIKLAGMKQAQEGKKLDPLLLTNLETHNPSGAKVHLDEAGVLHWPVLLMYPEYAQTDYIEDFSEQHW